MRAVLAVVAIAVVVAAAGIAIVVVLLPDTTNVYDLRVGDCFDLTLERTPGAATGELEDVSPFDCDTPHQAEVVLTGQLDPDGELEYPSRDAVLVAAVDARCMTVRDDVSDRFGLLPVAPDEDSWAPLGGPFLCLAIPYGGGTTTGSALASRE